MGLFIQQLQNNGKSSVPVAHWLVLHLRLLKDTCRDSWMTGKGNAIFLANMVFLWPSLYREEKFTCILLLDSTNNSQPQPAFLPAEEKSRTKYQPLAVTVSEGGKNRDFSEVANNFFSNCHKYTDLNCPLSSHNL